jgi:hypothetical protein
MTSIALLGCDQAGALQLSEIISEQINSGVPMTKEIDAALELKDLYLDEIHRICNLGVTAAVCDNSTYKEEIVDTCWIENELPDPAVTARQVAWCFYFELIGACKGAVLEIDELERRIEEEMNSSPSPRDQI